MDEKILKLYKKGFIKYLESVIDFSAYDKMVYDANLYFNYCSNIEKNISSEYYILLNDFYIDKISDSDKNIISSKEDIDDELIDIVKRTYKEVLKKGEYNYIMYSPALPEHNVVNGSLVFKFCFGKDTVSLGEEYIELYQKQRDFINNLNDRLIKEVSSKLNINCSVFVEKRL